MFICKNCQEEYNKMMCYSKDLRYCTKCVEKCTEFLSYLRETLASLCSMSLECKIIPTFHIYLQYYK